MRNLNTIEVRHKNRPKELNIVNKNNEYEPDAISSSSSITPTSYSIRTFQKPSKYPSALPTLVSTNELSLSTPTQAPLSPISNNVDTANRCVMRNDGTFGMKTQNKVETKYIYKIVLISNTSIEQINDEIIPELENTISKKILTSNFPQCRPSRQLNSQQVVVTGFSSLPKDTFMEDISCVTTSSNMCVYVNGGMTFYLAKSQGSLMSTKQDNPSTSSLQQLTASLVKQNMQSASLFTAHKHIIGVTYMEDDDFGLSISGMNSRTSDPVIAFPIAVGLAVFVVVTLLRKNRVLDLNQNGNQNMYSYE